jgi:hypothetical protein
MLAPWLELPGAPETVQRWSERTGLDLVALGTSASADEVRPTEVAQPLLTAVALLSGRALLGATAEGEGVPDLVCGHSIGELSALALAGVLSDDDAVALAARRGALMAQAAAVRPTGMAAGAGRHRRARRPAGRRPRARDRQRRGTGRRRRPGGGPRRLDGSGRGAGSGASTSPAPSTPPRWPRPSTPSPSSSGRPRRRTRGATSSPTPTAPCCATAASCSTGWSVS